MQSQPAEKYQLCMYFRTMIYGVIVSESEPLCLFNGLNFCYIIHFRLYVL